MSQNPPPPSDPQPAHPQPSSSGPPRISSRDLLRGGREILIEHEGEIYRLTLTRSGKLILHK